MHASPRRAGYHVNKARHFLPGVLEALARLPLVAFVLAVLVASLAVIASPFVFTLRVFAAAARDLDRRADFFRALVACSAGRARGVLRLSVFVRSRRRGRVGVGVRWRV